MGTTQLNQLTPLIEKESFIENDILQGDFEDTYRSVTRKVMMGFHFVKMHCPHVKRILVADDDALVLPWNIYPIVMSTVNSETDLYYSGFVTTTNNPIRSENSRWYVKPEEYNCTTYPPYPYGTVYALSLNTLKIFHYLSQVTRLFFFEDVYFGILAQIGNISITPLPDSAYIDKNCLGLFKSHSSQTIKDLIACHNMDEPLDVIKAWSEFCYSSTTNKTTDLLLKYCSYSPK